MTNLHDHIGQLFILGFRGSSLSTDSAIARDISQRNLGGVLLFDHFVSGTATDSNIVSPPQVAALCRDLQDMAGQRLLIGIDQEGGLVRRLKEKHGFPALPAAVDMGRDATCMESLRLASATGKLLAGLGINCDFAPVADVDVNADNPIIGRLGRSFSSDAGMVAKHCEAWIDGLQGSGVLACLKHFPGHGSSTADSHRGFVDISDSWSRDELLPYRLLVEKGKASAIMLGHLFHRDLDHSHPASLSPAVIGDLLRGQLGYTGLVLTDDLQMRAITERYGLTEAIVLALAAGADMIIIGNNLGHEPDILERAVAAVLRAVESGKLARETILAAYQRVQEMKDKLL